VVERKGEDGMGRGDCSDFIVDSERVPPSVVSVQVVFAVV